MPKFEQKYTEDDFLDAIKGTPKTVGYIARKVGCARSTTIIYLEKLLAEGKIVKESVDDGALFVYRNVKLKTKSNKILFDFTEEDFNQYLSSLTESERNALINDLRGED